MALSSTLIYGRTASGKTGLVGSWARWVHRETGKRIRYYTAEAGNTDTIGDLIDDGIIEVIDIGSLPYSAEALEFASFGYSWKDGKAIAPTAATWEEYSGFAYEGGTSFAETLMEELKAKGARNEIIGAEKPPQQYTSGELRIAGANQTFYGVIQGRLRRAINASHKHPVHSVWTCREVQAADDDMISGYKEVHGPQIIGQALTPHVPAWFGRTLHCDFFIDPATKKPTRKVFFKTHFYEGNKVPYVANPRLPVGVADELEESALISNDGLTLVKLFDRIKELRAKATNQLK